MTCIIGLVDADGTVWMGGDRRTSAAHEHYALAHPKVSRRPVGDGTMLIGYAGDPLSLILRGLALPAPGPQQDAMGYIVGPVRYCLTKMLRDEGLLTPGDTSLQSDTHFLVGYKGHLVWFQTTMLPVCVDINYDAVGVGSSEALAALHAMTACGAPPPQRMIETALRASADIVRTVGPPFDIINDRPE